MLRVWVSAFLFSSFTALGGCAVTPLPVSVALPAAEEHRPPRGLVQFCLDRPAHCTTAQNASQPLALTRARWRDLVDINWRMNRAILPRSDMDAFGMIDYWTDETRAGDCDDYVLAKRRALIDQGWPSENLVIVLADTEQGERHVILLAVTDQGDFVLDNRFDTVLPWTRLAYRWIARQSPDHLLNWRRVALSEPVPVAESTPAADVAIVPAPAS